MKFFRWNLQDVFSGWNFLDETFLMKFSGLNLLEEFFWMKFLVWWKVFTLHVTIFFSKQFFLLLHFISRLPSLNPVFNGHTFFNLKIFKLYYIKIRTQMSLSANNLICKYLTPYIIKALCNTALNHNYCFALK